MKYNKTNRLFKNPAIYLLVIFVFGSLIGFAQEQPGKVKKAVDWSKPEKIDILVPDIDEQVEINGDYYEGLAQTAYQNKDYKKAAQYYLFVLRQDPGNALVNYNLACCYGLMGEALHAAKFLVRAVKAGFRNFKSIQQDGDFQKVKANKTFADTLKKILKLEKNLGETFFVESHKLVPCRIHLPPNYDPQKKYPLVIGLHGNGGNPENFSSLRENFPENNFIFVALEGPYAFPGRNNQFSWGVLYQDRSTWVKGDLLSIESIYDAATEIAARYKTDKIYLMGFSQGTAYAYLTAIKHPQTFTGIIAISGMLPPTNDEYSPITDAEIEKGKKLRVFIAHGTQDNAIAISYSQSAGKRLSACGYDVSFFQFNAGHTVPTEVLEKIEKWLK